MEFISTKGILHTTDLTNRGASTDLCLNQWAWYQTDKNSRVLSQTGQRAKRTEKSQTVTVVSHKFPSWFQAVSHFDDGDAEYNMIRVFLYLSPSFTFSSFIPYVFLYFCPSFIFSFLSFLMYFFVCLFVFIFFFHLSLCISLFFSSFHLLF